MLVHRLNGGPFCSRPLSSQTVRATLSPRPIVAGANNGDRTRCTNPRLPTVYADWCGPCKMIAPTFESLATKYSKPKRITFAKINVDNQRDVASQYGVSAMPTFIILKNGSPIETIRGANPPSLIAAVEKAVKLAGPTASSGFSAPGRTLGGPGARPAGQSLRRPLKWDLNSFINAIIGFFGLYFVSLFSVRYILDSI